MEKSQVRKGRTNRGILLEKGQRPPLPNVAACALGAHRSEPSLYLSRTSFQWLWGPCFSLGPATSPAFLWVIFSTLVFSPLSLPLSPEKVPSEDHQTWVCAHRRSKWGPRTNPCTTPSISWEVPLPELGHFFNSIFIYLCIWLCQVFVVACGHPALGERSLSCWTTREAWSSVISTSLQVPVREHVFHGSPAQGDRGNRSYKLLSFFLVEV